MRTLRSAIARWYESVRNKAAARSAHAGFGQVTRSWAWVNSNSSQSRSMHKNGSPPLRDHLVALSSLFFFVGFNVLLKFASFLYLLEGNNPGSQTAQSILCVDWMRITTDVRGRSVFKCQATMRISLPHIQRLRTLAETPRVWWETTCTSCINSSGHISAKSGARVDGTIATSRAHGA